MGFISGRDLGYPARPDIHPLARKCPKRLIKDNQTSTSRQSVNAAQVEEGERPKMDALQLLNTLRGEEKAKLTATPFNELMYLDILVNEKPTMAMVDTGVTHNFVSDEEARRLGLTLENGELHMKAMNSEAKPINRVARDAVVKIESWLDKNQFYRHKLEESGEFPTALAIMGTMNS
ncbi:hypothetical protein EJ110_NYTH47874 [Nymphaea thermarum]|nr:hypothetical protein EJ110_NYTH47874 [Nymphaea thermarum]